MDFKKILDFPIYENGIGDLTLGMTFKDFRLKGYLSEKLFIEGYLKINAVFPSSIIYTFFDSIQLIFNLENSTLEGIDLYNSFKGLYFDNLGIGSNVLDLHNSKIDFKIDDDYIMITEGWGVTFVADEDLTLSNLTKEDKFSSKIEQIEIRFPR